MKILRVIFTDDSYIRTFVAISRHKAALYFVSGCARRKEFWKDGNFTFQPRVINAVTILRMIIL